MSLSFSRNSRRWLAPLLAASCVALNAIGADVDPAAPPAATPPVEAPAAPRPPRTLERTALGLFQDVHLYANEVSDHVVAIFGDAQVEGRVRENVVLIFGTGTIDAKVPGNVVAIFGRATLTQDVEGNVVGIFGDVTLGPGVTVDGNLVTIGSPTTIDPSAHVRGNSIPIPLPGIHHLGSWVQDDLPEGRLYGYNRRGTWVFIGVMLVISLLAAAIFRGPVDAGVSVLGRRPGAAFANGLLGALLVPPLFFLLTVSVVGTLVVPFAWVGAMFATLIGVVALSRFCGARLGFSGNPTLALIVGHFLFAILYMLPVIGFLAWGTVMMFGFGVALTVWGETRRERRAQEVAARKAKTKPATAPLPPSPPTAPAASVPVSSPAFQAQAPTPPTMPPLDPAAVEAAPPEPAIAPSPSAGPEAPLAAEAATKFMAEPPPPLAPATATPPLPPASAVAEPAEFWRRVAATLLDLLMVTVAVNVLNPFDRLDNYFLTIWFAYHIVFWAWRGTTLGGAVLNLRIQRLDGRPIDVGVALVRALGAVMSFLPLCLGFLWMNWDPEKQTWHDKIAGTVIVRLPRGQALI